MKTKAKKPLGEKREVVVYDVPCKCDEAVYVIEICSVLETRKRTYECKVRLMEEERMGEEDVGLAR